MSTIYDIAKEVGVSTATVSNAFNRPEQMKPETRQRILTAARKLGYQPNVNAQALASGKSLMVALLVADIRAPIVANITKGLEEKLLQAGLIPIIASTDGDKEKTLNMLKRLRQHGAGGYIIVPAQYGVPLEVASEIELLQASGTPIMVAGFDASSTKISYASIHGQQAARDLTRHLIDLGHTEIAYVGARFSKGHATARWLGYQEALLNQQIPQRPELVIETDPTPIHAFAAMEQLMSLPKPPTAVIAMSDIYATGIIDYTDVHSIRLPQDLSLATFDFSAHIQRATPAVTSIVASAYEIGQVSAALYLEIQADPSIPAETDLSRLSTRNP